MAKKGKDPPLTTWLRNADTHRYSSASDIPLNELEKAYGLAIPRQCKPSSGTLTVKPASAAKRKRVNASSDEEETPSKKRSGKQSKLNFTRESECTEGNCSTGLLSCIML